MAHDHGAGGSLSRDGFVVVDGAALDLLGALSDLGATRRGCPEAFMTSARDAVPEERLRLDGALKELLGPVVRDHIRADAEPFMGAYLVKGTSREWLPFHQDLTYTDEAHHRSYTAWVPLVDVDAANGAVAVVPGSHRWSGAMRAGGPTGSPDLSGLQDALRERSVTIEMTAGSLLVWDSAVLHGSFPNGSAADRPAAALAFAPAGAELRYFHRESGGPIEGFAIDDRFLAQPHPFARRPVGYPPAEPWGPLVTTVELAAALEQADRA